MNNTPEILNDRIDHLEKAMVDNFSEVDCPLVHTFLDGLYIREIFMPAGSLAVSKIHKTRHAYVVSEGVVSVWIDGVEQLIKATREQPFEGITEIGTRRVLYCHTDVYWATFHLNPDNENLEQIEERIIEKHDNLLLKNKEVWHGLQ